MKRVAKMGIWRNEISEEAKKQLWLSGPMVFVSVFQYSLQMISLMFVGHLDELLLAGVSLATSFVNVTGFSVLLGMSSALDTFCGQSYGAQQYHMVGIHMQRAIVIIMLATIPMSFIWAYLRPILVVLHQDKTIAAQAQLYATYLIPSLSANALLRCITKFLQTQNIVLPMMLASGFTTLAHALLCWLLVLKFGLGIKGAAIAFCISNWLNTVLLALYIRFSSSCKSTWTGFSRESLQNIPQFLSLAFPSALMIMVLLSGALPNPKLQTSVLSICFNTTGLFWMIPFGVSVAASTRISNELGAGCPKAAYLAVKVTLLMSFVVGALGFILLMVTRNIWGHIFTNIPEVIRYVASMTPILASSVFVDSIQTALSAPSSSAQPPPTAAPTSASSSSAQPPPTAAPTSIPPPLAVSHHPTLKTVAPMAPLPLPHFHTTNHHFQLSRSLPLSLRTAHCLYRHDHCREIPYGNDTILLGDDAIKHQIHLRLVWIFFVVKTWICSICHRRQRSPPHPPPHPPKPPPQPQPWLAQAELLGCGWQKLGAFVNLGSYYLVGLPFAIVLAFVLHIKGEGLLLGIVIALTMQVVGFLVITLRTNWEKEANKAAKRIRSNGVPTDANALPRDQNENLRQLNSMILLDYLHLSRVGHCPHHVSGKARKLEENVASSSPHCPWMWAFGLSTRENNGLMERGSQEATMAGRANGHLDELLLASTSLATSFVNATGFNVLNTSGIFWMIPFGISAAGSTRISNELGAGSPKAAYLAVKVTMFLASAVGILEFASLMILWRVWGRVFTNVHEVVKYVTSMMPLVASSTFIDSIQTAFQGAIFRDPNSTYCASGVFPSGHLTRQLGERKRMGIWDKEIADEVKKQLWVAGPMICVCVCQYSLQMMSLMFVGHLDELLLAGASLATSFVNVTGFNVLRTRHILWSRQYHMVGVHTQGAMLVLILVTIPVSIIWVFLGPILVALHQDKEIAAQAQQYARLLIPSLSANGLLRCIVKFLQTQSIVFPMVITSGLTIACYTFFSVGLLFSNLGLVSKDLSLQFAFQIGLIPYYLHFIFGSPLHAKQLGLVSERNHCIISQSFSNLLFLLHSWCGMIFKHGHLKLWCSCALPNAKLQTSVLSICHNTTGIFWMVPFEVSAAGSTRISNELGAGRAKAAYLAVKVTMFLASAVGILEFAALLLVRRVWGRAFTNVHEVVTYVTSMIPIVASSAFIDSIQTAFQGVARGCGWQKLGAFFNLGSYYFLGVPFAIVTAFVLHMKGQGLLLGIVLALIVQVVCFLVVTLRTNWEKEEPYRRKSNTLEMKLKNVTYISSLSYQGCVAELNNKEKKLIKQHLQVEIKRQQKFGTH
ncbi:Protein DETOXIFICATION 16 [Glycine soja]